MKKKDPRPHVNVILTDPLDEKLKQLSQRHKLRKATVMRALLISHPLDRESKQFLSVIEMLQQTSPPPTDTDQPDDPL